MRISLFRTFVKVVETGNLSRVAEELGISQPAVSKQVQALEETYGVLLMERAGRRLKPTEAGEALYRCAREIMKAVDKTERVMEDIAGGHKGRLVVGASTIPGEYILPAVVKEFKESNGHISISMEVGNTGGILNKVTEREIDVGVVGGWIPTRGVDRFKWLEDRLVLAVPNDSHLLQSEKVTLNDLLGEPWIFREKGSGTRRAIEETFRTRGLKREDLNIVAELGSTEAVLASVKAGMGISLVSVWAVKKAERSGEVRSLQVDGVDFRRSFYVVYPRQPQRRNAVESFLDYLKNVGEQPSLLPTS